MKKKFLAVAFVFLFSMIALSATIIAAQRTYLPVTIVDSVSDKTKITAFRVTKVENLSGRYMNRIHYTMTASKVTKNNAYIDVRCYNAAGKLLKIIELKYNYVNNNPIDVPDTTATIEFVGHNSSKGDSYLYRKTVTVYAADGRSMIITDLQVPVYELVGWSTTRPTTTSSSSSSSSNVAQKSALPVTITDNLNNRTKITSFAVTKVENIPGRYRNRIHYSLTAERVTSSNAYMDVKCYNAAGNLIETISITSKYVSNTPIDVPDTTATIELTGRSSSKGESYLYRKSITMFAPDGRSIAVTDLQAPVYELVGWKRPVTMYAIDGQVMDVAPWNVAAQKNVGWYTYDEFDDAIVWLCNDNKAKGIYEAAFRYIDVGLSVYDGTAHAQTFYTLRTQVMDAWRQSYGAPMAIVAVTGPQQDNLTLTVRNISYKNIKYFNYSFDAYDVYGRYMGECRLSYNSGILINVAEAKALTWRLSQFGMANVARVDNLRVTDVTFADGTRWYAN